MNLPTLGPAVYRPRSHACRFRRLVRREHLNLSCARSAPDPHLLWPRGAQQVDLFGLDSDLGGARPSLQSLSLGVFIDPSGGPALKFAANEPSETRKFVSHRAAGARRTLAPWAPESPLKRIGISLKTTWHLERGSHEQFSAVSL